MRKSVPVLAAAGLVLSIALPALVPAALAQPAVSEVIVRAPARPGSDVQVKTQVVSWNDLDIGDEVGVQKLLGRIRHAADVVCSPAPSRELSDVQNYDRCRDEAIHDAIAQVPSDALVPLYERVG